MKRYRDRKGTSGIEGYEILDDGIIIAFRDGGTYLYTNASAGAHHIAEMKRLAEAGRDLNTYINQHVHRDYERKLR